MSTESRAVFLSYASQDADPARKICDALRAAQVEVWFDQSELRGGDSWDQKIRKQIKECALFIPVVSANTQSRREGYFRLEWKLADDRTHLMARGTPFLLPVCIDDTKDWDAIVPESFTIVQWMRLPGGETSAAFCERVKTLLEGGEQATGDTRQATGDRRRETGNTEGQSVSRRRAARRPWLVPAVLGAAAIVALGVWQPWNKTGSVPAAATPGAETKSAAPLSEARQLVAKAWLQLNKPELARAELEVADELCKRASALDSNDADAWAAWSQVDAWYVWNNFEATPQRRDAARTKAARALQLTPASYEARLAEACYLVRGGGVWAVSADAGVADEILQALLRERPDEPRALHALGGLQGNTGRVAEARATFGRLAANPTRAVVAWNEIAWTDFFSGDYREAESAADRSIALLPFWDNLTIKTYLAFEWRGDLDRAIATFEQIPAVVRHEDHSVALGCHLYFLRREPAKLLRVFDGAPRDWLRSNSFDGPKAYWAALAYEQLGRKDLAHLQWQASLNLIERRLVDQPDSDSLLRLKTYVLAALGQGSDAAKTLRLIRDTAAPISAHHCIRDAAMLVRVGHPDAALDLLENEPRLPAAICRIEPRFEPLRALPRFQALVARLEADPRRSPNAKSAGASAPSPSSLLSSSARPSEADQKSVAVLAFENRSSEKDSEYFSDGISEELLNVLAKVPGLRVVGRTSSFQFKGKNEATSEIGRKLNVAHLVEGSVQRIGSRARIIARLIRTDNGTQVWSGGFDSDLKDIFGAQEQIAAVIAKNLSLTLGPGVGAGKTVNPEAHQLVLEARHFLRLRSDDGFANAERAFGQAITRDPEFAVAHSGLAEVFAMRATYAIQDGASLEAMADDIRRAKTEAARAATLDPDLPAAYSVAANMLTVEGRYADAEREFEKAAALNSNEPVLFAWRAVLRLTQGRLRDALDDEERTERLDPFWPIVLAIHGEALLYARRYDEALQMTQRLVALRPDDWMPNVGNRARILLALGRTKDAVEAARSVRSQPGRKPRREADPAAIWVLCQAGLQQEAESFAEDVLKSLPPESHHRGFVLGALGRFDEALPFLERTPPVARRRLFWDLMWDPWREDPRFRQLIQKLGSVGEYQIARESLMQMLKEQEKK